MLWLVWTSSQAQGRTATSSVIAFRTLKIAAGGVAAEVEVRQMVSEKLETGMALQALTGGLGLTVQSAVTKVLAHYRCKVRANRRRLAKG